MNKKKIDIFLYDNYRVLLKDLTAYHKSINPNFSHRYFASKSGFATSSFLKLVIDGKRNLTNESILKISRGFDFSEQEKFFFEKLVYFNQSKNFKDKNYYYKQLIAIPKFTKFHILSREQNEYFSKWYHCVVRELCVMFNGSLTSKQIADMLIPRITVIEVNESLNLLKKLELIKQDQNKKWEHSHPAVITPEEIQSFFISSYHKEMIKLALQSIDRFKAEERNITSLTLNISSNKFEQIKEKIRLLREELLNMAIEDKDSDMVYQLNFQVFPLVKNCSIQSQK